MRNVLITGGAGFIGSNFIEFFMDKYPHYTIINLDMLTYAGNLENLKAVRERANYTFIQGDICDKQLLRHIFRTYNIDSVIHFAAQSHVDNSIRSPQSFIQSNIVGTFALLEIAKESWLDTGLKHKTPFGIFHHISTDEVYGSLGSSGLFSESSPYAPNSPYAASKASSDMLVRSFHHTYGLRTFITNCSNNYGPRQHHEKLIPTIINNALSGNAIPIYGDGGNVRDWLYVLDHCEAIDRVFHSQAYGETYNIGGNNEYTNIQIAQKICAILDDIAPKRDGKYADQITFVQDRLGHDRRYGIDSSKISATLGWQQTYSFEDSLRDTIIWYHNIFTQNHKKEFLCNKQSSRF